MNLSKFSGGRALAVLVLALAAAVAPSAPASAFSAPSDISLGPVPVNESVHFPVPVEPDEGWFFNGSGGGSGTGPGHAILLGGDCSTHQTTACTLDGLFIADGGTGEFASDEYITQCRIADETDCRPSSTIHVSANVVAVTGGTLKVATAAATPGGSFSVTSVTPCITGVEKVRLVLYSAQGTTVASRTASLLDGAGNWAGSLPVPATAPAGSYVVSAQCLNHDLAVRSYKFVPVNVQKAATTLTAGKVKKVANTTFSATLMSPNGPVPNATVTFTMPNGLFGPKAMCSGTTDANGVASCVGANTAAQVFFATNYTATFAGNSGYLATSSKGSFG